MKTNRIPYAALFLVNACLLNGANAASLIKAVTPQGGAQKNHLTTPSKNNLYSGWKDMENQPVYKAGPYVGISFGPRMNINASRFNYIGGEGTLSAGLAHLWRQQYYLAAEAFGSNSLNLHTSNVQLNTISPRHNLVDVQSIRSTWSYGIDIIPGLMLNDKTMIYMRGGVVRTHVKIDSNLSDFALNDDGWRLGLGTQTTLYKNFDIRLEYIAARYQETTVFISDRKTKPFSTLCNLGLVYKFV